MKRNNTLVPKGRKQYFFLALVFLIGLFIPNAIGVLAYVPEAKWQLPYITYSFSPTVSTLYKDCYRWAAKEWYDTPTRLVFSEASSSGKAYCQAEPVGYTAWDGMAIRGFDNAGYIINASVTLNRYFTDGYSTMRVKMVTLHELGHVTGLGHDPYHNNVIMYGDVNGGRPWDAYLNNTDLQYGPAANDIEGINFLYPLN